MVKKILIIILLLVCFNLYAQQNYERDYDYESYLIEYYDLFLEVYIGNSSFKFVDTKSVNWNDIIYNVSLVLTDLEYFFEEMGMSVTESGVEFIMYKWGQTEIIFEQRWLMGYFNLRSYNRQYEMLNDKLTGYYRQKRSL